MLKSALGEFSRSGLDFGPPSCPRRGRGPRGRAGAGGTGHVMRQGRAGREKRERGEAGRERVRERGRERGREADGEGTSQEEGEIRLLFPALCLSSSSLPCGSVAARAPPVGVGGRCGRRGKAKDRRGHRTEGINRN